MKTAHLVAASGLVLVLCLLPVGAKQPDESTASPKPHLEIQKADEGSQEEAVKSESGGTEQDRHHGESSDRPGMTFKRAWDFVGTKLVSNAGEQVGEVQAIVRENGTGRLYAVVAMGDTSGTRSEQVAVGLEHLYLEGGHLVAPLVGTKEHLKAYPAYEARLYEKVPGEAPIGVRNGRG